MTIRGMRRWKGRVERAVGEATGDRRVEALGAEEARLGEFPDPLSIDRSLYAVRREHGDIEPNPE